VADAKVVSRDSQQPNNKEAKLFIGMLPKNITEQDLRDVFLPYGDIKEVLGSGSSSSTTMMRCVNRFT
jgi:RNA recognition motif-containing protein